MDDGTVFTASAIVPVRLWEQWHVSNYLKMSQILAQTRKLKQTFLAELADPEGYQLQHVDDPEGNCGISATIIVRDRDSATQYARSLESGRYTFRIQLTTKDFQIGTSTPTGTQSWIKTHIIRLAIRGKTQSIREMSNTLATCVRILFRF